jgi:23S rRNA pseudouridine955/2504/2580 synthase
MKKQNILITTKAETGLRIDKFLMQRFPLLSFSMVQKLVRKGQIRLDGKRTKPNVILEKDQELRLPPTDLFEKTTAPPTKISVSDKALQKFKCLFIYEDDHVYVLNKPAGLAVQGGSKLKTSVDHYFDAIEAETGEKPRIVHRLDKETSGCLIIAKTKEAAQFYGAHFKGKAISKFYLALTSPPLGQTSGLIDKPLAKQMDRYYDKVKIDHETGKSAQTYFEVLAKNKNASLVLCSPLTGRTHQIRVHLSSLGAPILGDSKYGSNNQISDYKNKIENLYLHAWQICFPDFENPKEMIDVSAALPDYYNKLLKSLNFSLPSQVHQSYREALCEKM